MKNSAGEWRAMVHARRRVLVGRIDALVMQRQDCVRCGPDNNKYAKRSPFPCMEGTCLVSCFVSMKHCCSCE